MMKFVYIIQIFLLCYINNTIAYTYYSEVGMYYKKHNEKVGWYEAVKICESEGASLAMPRNKAEVDVMLRLSTNSVLMIGFHSLFAEFKFTTINGDDLQYYYNIWDTYQPNEGVGQCGFINKLGKLHDGYCKQNLLFVCEKETSSRKKQSSDPNCLINDSEYRYAPEIEKCYKFHMNPDTFITAEKICKGEGGHLTIIRNLEQEKFLSNMFKEPKYSGFQSKMPPFAYVGVHEKFQKGTYRTVLNELFTDVNYAHWDPKGSRVATEHCISMNKEGMLDTFVCENPGIFICEQPSIKATKTSKNAMKMTWTENSKSSRENINLNVVVNNVKHCCAEPNIELCNHS